MFYRFAVLVRQIAPSSFYICEHKRFVRRNETALYTMWRYQRDENGCDQVNRLKRIKLKSPCLLYYCCCVHCVHCKIFCMHCRLSYYTLLVFLLLVLLFLMLCDAPVFFCARCPNQRDMKQTPEQNAAKKNKINNSNGTFNLCWYVHVYWQQHTAQKSDWHSLVQVHIVQLVRKQHAIVHNFDSESNGIDTIQWNERKKKRTKHKRFNWNQW